MKRKIKISTFHDLFSKANRVTKVVNFITLYRVVMAPVLLILLFNGNYILFRWLLLSSFSTDMIDGYLARKYKANTILGAKLDSVGDDMTVFVGIIGLFKLKFDFVKEELVIVIILLSLFFIQLIISLIRYGKFSSFHTYAAKISALAQGTFLLSMFFFKNTIYPLFYFAAIITTIELVEEIILVFILPKWKIDVKGLFWVLRKNKV